MHFPGGQGLEIGFCFLPNILFLAQKKKKKIYWIYPNLFNYVAHFWNLSLIYLETFLVM